MPEHVKVASERPFITCIVEHSSQLDACRADESLAPNVDIRSGDGHHVEINLFKAWMKSISKTPSRSAAALG